MPQPHHQIKMKVVMVDDSAEDRTLCRTLLEEVYGPGLQFFEESEAVEGLKTCRTVAPDCVLLEYKLPDMTGLEFLAQLQAETPLNEPAFAVVMLTGLSSCSFGLYQRPSPTNNTYNTFPPATAGYAKLVSYQWSAGRRVVGTQVNTESVQTALVYLRNR